MERERGCSVWRYEQRHYDISGRGHSVDHSTHNKQKYFETHLKEIWCKQNTNGSKKKSNSLVQNAAERRKLHLCEESLARHCFDFEMDTLVDQVAL